MSRADSCTLGIHSLITGAVTQNLDTTAQNFHTNVIFNSEFNGGVQICDFLCAYVIKIKKN